MDLNDIVSNLTVIGVAVTVISFIAYVFAPSLFIIILFALGIAMMVGGYTYVTYQNRNLFKQISDRMDDLDSRGYIMSLDGAYVPDQDEATIETLE